MTDQRQSQVESVMATNEPENPAGTERLLEEVCARKNMFRALKRVKENKGAPGVDKMTTTELPGYLRKHWPTIREQLMAGTYEPKPIRRVEIAKPSGGLRPLGIPCVLDRLIQQAVLQVLQERWDPTFSEYSYGFRPGRSQHQAVAQAQQYVAEGNDYVVDLDLEKFFDRVNHDRLMARVAHRVSDKRLLKLIRSFLNAGIFMDGLVKPPTEEGVPQGGPLSPLLSNLYLDDLDRELTKRGHRFVRYADDCNVYVRTERAGHRVMKSIKRYLDKKLKLKVNEKKSKVARVGETKFLGFRIFRWRGQARRDIAPESVKRLKQKVRKLTGRERGQSLADLITGLSKYLIGWNAYYGFCETIRVFRDLDSWIRRRLRSYVWAQWKTGRRRYDALVKLGLSPKQARHIAWRARMDGPWRISRSRSLCIALPNKYFHERGLFSLAVK